MGSEIIVEFNAERSGWGYDAWVRTPSNKSFTSVEDAIKWIAQFGTDVKYRVSTVLAPSMSLREAKERTTP